LSSPVCRCLVVCCCVLMYVYCFLFQLCFFHRKTWVADFSASRTGIKVWPPLINSRTFARVIIQSVFVILSGKPTQTRLWLSVGFLEAIFNSDWTVEFCESVRSNVVKVVIIWRVTIFKSPQRLCIIWVETFAGKSSLHRCTTKQAL